MRRIATLATLVMLAARPPLQAQSLGVGAHDTGISFGNTPVWNGWRINWRDDGVQRVNGVNVTLWRPGRNAEFRMNGVALGLVAPVAHSINGVAIGLGGVATHQSMNGIALGGLGVVSDGTIRGVSISGLGTVAAEGISGLSLAGLGMVSQGAATGVHVAGLANVSQGSMRWVNVAGLASVSNRTMHGLNVAGLALVGDEGVRGVSVAGLAVVAGEGAVEGITAAAGAVVGGTAIRGITMAGLRVQAPNVDGITAAAGMMRTQRLRGFSIAGYNDVQGLQAGFTIGVYNSADVLKGVQVGLLNRAKNNRPPFRWLPILNAHF